MKNLKTFEEHNNPYLHQPNVDNTEFPPPSSDDDSTKEELRKQINDLINEFENKYGTWSRINYKGGW